jgi:hypothetical protein
MQQDYIRLLKILKNIISILEKYESDFEEIPESVLENEIFPISEKLLGIFQDIETVLFKKQSYFFSDDD